MKSADKIELKLIIEELLEKQISLTNLHFKPIKNKEIDSLKFLLEERSDQ